MHTPHPRLAHVNWRTSSYTGASGDCVEIAQLADGGWAVRDSKDPTGPALLVTPAAWATFTTDVCNGTFA